MANKSSKKSSSSSSKSTTVWSLNKISMYTLVAVAILYVVSLIVSCIKFDAVNVVVRALQGVATAIMIVIVSILAWRYVRNKQAVWKVLYILCLLLVIVGIIIPMIML